MTEAKKTAPAKKTNSATKSDKKVERNRFSALNDWLGSHKKISIALWGLALAVWVGVVFLAVDILAIILFSRLVPSEVYHANWFSALFSVLVYVVSLAIIVFIPWRLYGLKTTRDELGLRGLPTWTDILLAPIGYVLVILVLLVLSLFLPLEKWAEVKQETGFHGMGNMGNYMLAFFCLVILAPIMEEVMFRGWLYGKLRARMTALPAIIIVSAMFGIVHMRLDVGIKVFVMSAIMCVSRELTGTIWSGVLLHMVNNGLAMYALIHTGGMM